MKLIYTTADRLAFGHMVSLFVSEGITYRIKNDFLSGGGGDIPLNEVWPELWVVEERDHQRSEELVHSLLKGDQEETGEPWTCPQCAEQIEGNFYLCWQCGAERNDP